MCLSVWCEAGQLSVFRHRLDGKAYHEYQCLAQGHSGMWTGGAEGWTVTLRLLDTILNVLRHRLLVVHFTDQLCSTKVPSLILIIVLFSEFFSLNLPSSELVAELHTVGSEGMWAPQQINKTWGTKAGVTETATPLDPHRMFCHPTGQTTAAAVLFPTGQLFCSDQTVGLHPLRAGSA